MGFSPKQLSALRRSVDHRHVRVRQSNGRELSYLEGWYVVSQANRIFGFDGWSRETLESKCVLARENRGYFTAVYTAKVRLTIEANGTTIIREGHGTGEGRGELPGEVHDTALKAAETDATKRALITFGRPFGLELYRSDRKPAAGAGGGVGDPVRRSAGAIADHVPARPSAPAHLPLEAAPPLANPQPVVFTPGKPHPDDGTPIPRPSTYFGRERFHQIREEAGALVKQSAQGAYRSERAATSPASRSRIDKSALALPEPRRLRDKAHLAYVASQPCLICGRQPADPHHLRFAQPRAIGLKVSDEFTVPLCRGHHRTLHQSSDEPRWWTDFHIEPLAIARKLWEDTHPVLMPVKDRPLPPADRAQKPGEPAERVGTSQRSQADPLAAQACEATRPPSSSGLPAGPQRQTPELDQQQNQAAAESASEPTLFDETNPITTG